MTRLVNRGTVCRPRLCLAATCVLAAAWSSGPAVSRAQINRTFQPPIHVPQPPRQTYTPPVQTYQPPRQTYTPPVQTHQPPRQTYTPPAQIPRVPTFTPAPLTFRHTSPSQAAIGSQIRDQLMQQQMQRQTNDALQSLRMQQQMQRQTNDTFQSLRMQQQMQRQTNDALQSLRMQQQIRQQMAAMASQQHWIGPQAQLQQHERARLQQAAPVGGLTPRELVQMHAQQRAMERAMRMDFRNGR